jgi:hypothetical protein
VLLEKLKHPLDSLPCGEVGQDDVGPDIEGPLELAGETRQPRLAASHEDDVAVPGG